jgi:protein involved in polysaccharide export with SLBB domain
MAQTPAVAEAPQPANATASPSSPRLLANSNVKLGIGDLIEIAVFGVPELSIKTRISGSGDIYLPLIDYVHVADLTTDEAQELVQKRLEDGGFVPGPARFHLCGRVCRASRHRWWEKSPAPDLTRRSAIVDCSTCSRQREG